MKVKELISELSKHDPELEVICYTEDEQFLQEKHLFRLIEIEWIAANGKKAEIHCHTIVNGQCNLEPELYSNIKDIDIRNRKTDVRNWNFVPRV